MKKKLMSFLMAVILVAGLIPTMSIGACAALDTEVNPAFTAVAEDSHEVALFGMAVLTVTNGEHDGKALDLGGADSGKSIFYAPFSCTVSRVYESAGCHAVWFTSTGPVHWADGRLAPATVLFIHMEDVRIYKTYMKNKTVIRQGQPLVLEGNYGASAGLSFGNHLHAAAATSFKGNGWFKNKNGAWEMSAGVGLNKLYYVSPKATTVAKDGGLDWVEYVDYKSEPTQLMLKVTKSKAALHTYPEAGGKVVRYAQSGDMVHATAVITNAAGNTWYKLSSGLFIYGKYVSVDVSSPAATVNLLLANAEVDSGSTYRIQSSNGKTLYASGTGNGSKLKVGSASGSKAAFKLTFDEDNSWWTASCKAKSSMIINAYAQAPKDGTAATLYKKIADDPSQRLILQRAGSGYILRLAYDVDLVLTRSGSGVKFAAYQRDNANQIWTLSKV